METSAVWRQCSRAGVMVHSWAAPLISIIFVLRSTWLTSPVAGMMDWPSMPSSTATGTANEVCVRVSVHAHVFFSAKKENTTKYAGRSNI